MKVKKQPKYKVGDFYGSADIIWMKYMNDTWYYEVEFPSCMTMMISEKEIDEENK